MALGAARVAIAEWLYIAAAQKEHERRHTEISHHGVQATMHVERCRVADVLDSFRQHATRSTRDFEVYPQLRHLGCIAVSMGPQGEQAFSTLLDDEVEAVRYFAARLALDLGMDPDRPMRVLRVVGKSDSPLAWPARVRLVILDQTGR